MSYIFIICLPSNKVDNSSVPTLKHHVVASIQCKCLNLKLMISRYYCVFIIPFVINLIKTITLLGIIMLLWANIVLGHPAAYAKRGKHNDYTLLGKKVN